MVFSSLSWHWFCLILLLLPWLINHPLIEGKGRDASRGPKTTIS
jgi:hypothetical protein